MGVAVLASVAVLLVGKIYAHSQMTSKHIASDSLLLSGSRHLQHLLPPTLFLPGPKARRSNSTLVQLFCHLRPSSPRRPAPPRQIRRRGPHWAQRTVLHQLGGMEG